MNDPTLAAQVAAARAYEDVMLPALFGQWAPRLADAVPILSGHRVLDVACGTGIVGRESAWRAGPHGFVVGVDPNLGMLDVARRLAPALSWSQGVAESLPFADRTFDAVVCQFGLMFFRDPHQAIREALRVLVPGGRLAFVVWDRLESMPAYATEVALLERVAGRRAADALRAPFALGAPDHLAAMFRTAGAGAVEYTTESGTGQFAGVRTMVEADLRGWLPLMDVFVPEDEIAQILLEAEHVLAPYVRTDRTVVFGTSAHIVTALKP